MTIWETFILDDYRPVRGRDYHATLEAIAVEGRAWYYSSEGSSALLPSWVQPTPQFFVDEAAQATLWFRPENHLHGR